MSTVSILELCTVEILFPYVIDLFLKKGFIFFKNYVYWCLRAYMPVYLVHAWCPQGPEEGIGSPGTGVI